MVTRDSPTCQDKPIRKGPLGNGFRVLKNQKKEPDIQTENNPICRGLGAIAEVIEVSLEQKLNQKP